MMGKNQHVTEHSSGGWQVKDAGNSQATARTSTQQQAIHIALHQHSELIIRGTDDNGNEACFRAYFPFETM